MANRRSRPVTEADVIAAVQARWGQRLDSRVRVGLGDDCAVLSLPRDKQTVVTTDLLVEGIHFSSRNMFSHWSLGWKALAVSISDILSMGARPRWAVGTLGIPANLTSDQLEGLLDGVNHCAEQFGVEIVGGDTVAAHHLTVGFTVLGELAGEPLLRSGARPGQLVWHNGLQGVSQVGLHVMWGKSGAQPNLLPDKHYELAETAHCFPYPRWGFDSSNATAALDTSDSLAQSLFHLARASDVGLLLDFRDFDFHEVVLAFSTACRRRRNSRSSTTLPSFTVPAAYDPSCQPQRHASLAAFLLAASEDYGMLYTSNASAAARRAHSKVSQLLGKTVPTKQGYRYIDEVGMERELTELGWKHR